MKHGLICLIKDIKHYSLIVKTHIWILLFQEFDFEIIVKLGRLNS